MYITIFQIIRTIQTDGKILKADCTGALRVRVVLGGSGWLWVVVGAGKGLA